PSNPLQKSTGWQWSCWSCRRRRFSSSLPTGGMSQPRPPSSSGSLGRTAVARRGKCSAVSHASLSVILPNSKSFTILMGIGFSARHVRGEEPRAASHSVQHHEEKKVSESIAADSLPSFADLDEAAQRLRGQAVHT